MGMPTWWRERRLGLLVHATAATVPAWAPIGEGAEWYRSHLDGDLPDVALHPRPMVEVIAHHRDRWGHIEQYDDFVPLLTFDDFDAEAWAELARSAGAGYSVLVAKHHDGWAWWDAPNTERRLTDHGPARNVLAEYAAACERNDITFGTYYSLLDWGDGRSASNSAERQTYVDEVLHPHVIDLVERYGSAMLWGDGHWGGDAGTWKTAALLDAVRSIDPDIVVNDRWWASSSDVPDGRPDIVQTYDHTTPDRIVDGPWELCRGIGDSFGYNRAERAEHHMTALDIVDLYTEVLAKGGNLLLNVGSDSSGTIPELQAGPLRDAGEWIRRFDDVIASTRPWSESGIWGGPGIRYLRSDESTSVDDHDRPQVVYAVDCAGRGALEGISPDDFEVHSVQLVGPGRGDPADVRGDIEFRHDDTGLHVRHRPGDDVPIGVHVYRLTLSYAERPIELFAPVPTEPIALAPLLDDAVHGAIVQLGDGDYVGPATIPPGVTLRGLGPGRSRVVVERSGIRPIGPALTVGAGARVEHLAVCGPDHDRRRVQHRLVVIDGDSATLLGTHVGGSIDVTADDVTLRAVTARGVRAENADRLHVSRCTFDGNRWDTGVRLVAGGGHMMESCEFVDHLCAVHADGTTGSEICGNAITARWWGVRLDRCEDAHVHANRVSGTMRAVDVDGGANSVIDGNAVANGDSGCVVQDGASRTQISGNHWDRCRIGLLSWNATDLSHSDNVCTDLHDVDGAFVSGP